MQLEEYRTALERFHEALQREEYLYHSGRKSRLELAGIYADHSDLFSDQTRADLDRALESIPVHFESKARGVRKLRRFAMECTIERASIEIDEALAELERTSTVPWDGAEIPIGASGGYAAREPDRRRRRRLDELRLEARAKERAMRRQRGALRRSAARALGLASESDAQGCTSGVDPTGLAAAAERLLDETRADYLDRLAPRLAASSGLGLAEARRCDLAYWERSSLDEFRDGFPKRGLIAALEETLAPLGIDPSGQPGLTIEIDPADGGSGRSFCAAPRIPGDVRVVVRASDGPRDYARLLHEAGHAEHLVSTSPTLAAEHRLLGDRALPEGFAFLFEGLASEVEWLGARLGDEARRSYLATRALSHAYHVRREAGKLIAGVRLDRDPAPLDPAREYAVVLADAAGVACEPEEYVEGCDDPAESGAYLRGWSFAVGVGELLRRKFGHAWFRTRGAGALLREVWETGQLYTADELARELGSGPIELAALADGIRRELRR